MQHTLGRRSLLAVSAGSVVAGPRSAQAKKRPVSPNQFVDKGMRKFRAAEVEASLENFDQCAVDAFAGASARADTLLCPQMACHAIRRFTFAFSPEQCVRSALVSASANNAIYAPRQWPSYLNVTRLAEQAH